MATALTTLRCVVRSLHLERTGPIVTLASPSEHFPFCARVSKAQALELGRRMFEPLDVSIRHQRDPVGLIHSCEVTEICPMDEGVDATTAWREWFAKACPNWTEADDDAIDRARRED